MTFHFSEHSLYSTITPSFFELITFKSLTPEPSLIKFRKSIPPALCCGRIDKTCLPAGRMEGFMIFIDILYVILIAVGVLGVGHWFWDRIKKESLSAVVNNTDGGFNENPFLTISISWFLGYFIYEGILQIMAAGHLFYPAAVLLLGAALSAAGWAWILSRPTAGLTFVPLSPSG